MLTLSECSNEKSGTTHENGLDCQFEVVPEYIPSSSRLKFELLQVISECNNVCLSNNAIMQCLFFALEGDALEGDALEGDALEGDALEGDALDAGLFDEPFDCIRGDFEFVAPGPTNRYSYMRELKRF